MWRRPRYRYVPLLINTSTPCPGDATLHSPIHPPTLPSDPCRHTRHGPMPSCPPQPHAVMLSSDPCHHALSDSYRHTLLRPMPSYAPQTHGVILSPTADATAPPAHTITDPRATPPPAARSTPLVSTLRKAAHHHVIAQSRRRPGRVHQAEPEEVVREVARGDATESVQRIPEAPDVHRAWIDG